MALIFIRLLVALHHLVGTLKCGLVGTLKEMLSLIEEDLVLFLT